MVVVLGGGYGTVFPMDGDGHVRGRVYEKSQSSGDRITGLVHRELVGSKNSVILI